MSSNAQADFERYAQRVLPYCMGLFNAAYLITGNPESAEFCLQYTLMDQWTQFSDRTPSDRLLYRELLNTVTRTAYKECGKNRTETELPLEIPENSDTILVLTGKERPEVRKVFLLRYGCGLTPRQIARITGQKPRRMVSSLLRIEERIMRKLKTDRHHATDAAKRSARTWLSFPSPQAPDANRLLAALQAETDEVDAPHRLPIRMIRLIFTALMALVCMVVFWLAAVMLQPNASAASANSIITEQAE